MNDSWLDPDTQITTTLASMNATALDADGDGATNDEEAQEGANPYVSDTDYDGLSDGDELHLVRVSMPSVSLTTWDSDGDFISDYDEYHGFTGVVYANGQLPAISGATYSDYDGDGIKNPEDPFPTDATNTSNFNAAPYAWYGAVLGDQDGDGLPNWQDPYPTHDANYSFVNFMYWYGNVLGDADSDGLLNWQDPVPYPITPQDPDGDGIDSSVDPYPTDATNYSSANNYYWYSEVLMDPDSDGLPNWQDPFPTDGTNYSYLHERAWYGDVLLDDDSDSFPNWQDPFPWDATNTTIMNGSPYAWYGEIFGDVDGDGTLNWQDGDSYSYVVDGDGDGIVDAYDPFSSDSTNYSYYNYIAWYGDVLGDLDSDGYPNWQDSTPYPDSDGDGIPDHSDPYPNDPNNNPPMDTDGDGIPDSADPYPNDPYNGQGGPTDADGDGLSSTDETNYGTSDYDVDCDDDGLTDYEELLVYQSNPLNAYSISQQRGWGDLYMDPVLVNQSDSDADGLPDSIEWYYGLNAYDAADAAGDLDSNGINNLDQYLAGIALNSGSSAYDSDNDGMTDVFEDYYQLNKYDATDAVADPDGDGVLNYEEKVLVTSPNNPDTDAIGGRGDLILLAKQLLYPQGAPANTDQDANGNPDWFDVAIQGAVPRLEGVASGDLDGDGMSDTWEHKHGKWRYPLHGMDLRKADNTEDAEEDGLTNGQEFELFTHPLMSDTDGDGESDSYENANATDPTSSGSASGFPDPTYGSGIPESGQPGHPDSLPDRAVKLPNSFVHAQAAEYKSSRTKPGYNLKAEIYAPGQKVPVYLKKTTKVDYEYKEDAFSKKREVVHSNAYGRTAGELVENREYNFLLTVKDELETVDEIDPETKIATTTKRSGSKKAQRKEDTVITGDYPSEEHLNKEFNGTYALGGDTITPPNTWTPAGSWPLYPMTPGGSVTTDLPQKYTRMASFHDADPRSATYVVPAIGYSTPPTPPLDVTSSSDRTRDMTYLRDIALDDEYTTEDLYAAVNKLNLDKESADNRFNVPFNFATTSHSGAVPPAVQMLDSTELAMVKAKVKFRYGTYHQYQSLGFRWKETFVPAEGGATVVKERSWVGANTYHSTPHWFSPTKNGAVTITEMEAWANPYIADLDAEVAAEAVPEEMEEEPGMIVGLSDPLQPLENRIFLKPISHPSIGGKYQLSFPDNVRLWHAADRTGQVQPSDEFSVTTETTLFVEVLQDKPSDPEALTTAVGIVWKSDEGKTPASVFCDAIRVQVVALKEVWETDQKWNKVPNPKNPPNYRNDILMLPLLFNRILFVSEEVESGQVELTVKSSPNFTMADHSLLVGVREATNFVTNTAILPGSRPVSQNGVTAIKFTPTGDLLPSEKREFQVVLGFDLDSNGKLSAQEVVLNDAPYASRVHVKAMTRNDVDHVRDQFSLLWLDFYHPVARNFLQCFLFGHMSQGDVMMPMTLHASAKPNPTHIAGSSYDSYSGLAIIPLWKLGEGTTASNKIEESFDRTIPGGLRDVIKAVWQANRATFEAPFRADSSLQSKKFSPMAIASDAGIYFYEPGRTESSILESGTTDLEVSYGEATISGNITFELQRDAGDPNKLVLKSVDVDALVKDLYDFDWTRHKNSLSRLAATLQISWEEPDSQFGKIFATETVVKNLYDGDSAIATFNGSFWINLSSPPTNP